MAYNTREYQRAADALAKARERIDAEFPHATYPRQVAFEAWEITVRAVADHLRASHRGAYPFRTERFLRACGL